MPARGGAGKTRLMLEWCNRLRDRGEYAGFLHGAEPDDLDAFFGGVGRRVAVIDYAETRPELLRALVQTIEEWQHKEPEKRDRIQIRVVLLARKSPEDGEWWQRLEELLQRREWGLIDRHLRTRALEELLPELSDRREHFEEAGERFAAVMGRSKEEIEAPKLEAEHFGHPLYVQMAGYAALFGKQLSGAAELLDEVLRHETDYWNKRLKNEDLSGRNQKKAFECAENVLVLLTLWGGVAEDELEEVVRLSFPGASDRGRARIPGDLIEIVRELVLEFYSEESDDTGPARRLRGLQPDVLGEHLIDRQFEDAESPRSIQGPRLLKNAVEEADESRKRSNLRILTRLAQRRPGAGKWLERALSGRLAELGAMAMEITMEVGDPLGKMLAEVFEEEGDAELAWELRESVSGNATPLTEIWLETAKELLRHHREHYPRLDSETRLHRIHRLNDLAVAYGSGGDYERQVDLLEDARELAQTLKDSDKEEVKQSIARTLDNLSVGFFNLGKHADALEATEESLKLHRELYEERPEKYAPGLAMALNNVSNGRSELGRYAEALEATEKSLELYRELYEERPEKYAPDLAMALTNLSIRKSKLGKFAEALEATEESLELYRALYEERPEKHAPDVGWTLSQRASVLNEMEEFERALSEGKKARRIYRELPRARRQTFAERVAWNTVNLGVALRELDKHDEAFEEVQDGVGRFRQLADDRPAKFEPELAEALVELAKTERRMGEREEARQHGEEALRLYREELEDRPLKFWEDLADALEWSAELCEELRQDDEAAEKIREVESLRNEYEGDA